MEEERTYKTELLPPERNTIFYTYNPVISDDKVVLIKAAHNEEWAHTFSEEPNEVRICSCDGWMFIFRILLIVTLVIGIGAYMIFYRN